MPVLWRHAQIVLAQQLGGSRYRDAAPEQQGTLPMDKDTFRVVTRGADGQIRIRDYDTQEALLKRHCQVGVDDCSTDLGLRGLPVFRGLIGPMPEGQNVIRYESPEVFETLTKDWSSAKPVRRRSPHPFAHHLTYDRQEIAADSRLSHRPHPSEPAGDQLVARVNRAIAAGRVKNRAGRLSGTTHRRRSAPRRQDPPVPGSRRHPHAAGRRSHPTGANPLNGAIRGEQT